MVSCNMLWIDPTGYHPSAPCTRLRVLLPLLQLQEDSLEVSCGREWLQQGELLLRPEQPGLVLPQLLVQGLGAALVPVQQEPGPWLGLSEVREPCLR